MFQNLQDNFELRCLKSIQQQLNSQTILQLCQMLHRMKQERFGNRDQKLHVCAIKEIVSTIQSLSSKSVWKIPPWTWLSCMSWTEPNWVNQFIQNFRVNHPMMIIYLSKERYNCYEMFAILIQKLQNSNWKLSFKALN